MAPLLSYGLVATSCLCLFPAANGAPASVPASKSATSTVHVRAPVPEPQLIGGLVGGLVGTVGTLTKPLLDVLDQTLNDILHPQPTILPQSIDDILGFLQVRYQNKNNTGYVDNGKDYALNGVLSKITGAQGLLGATINEGSLGINSFTNSNPAPPKTIYPQSATSDPKFSVSESALRSAIFIPPTFKADKAPNPVLLIPGTATMGGVNFDGNFAKILSDGKIAQPLWLNVPTALLQDAQISVEYIAYAINYVKAITGNKVNVIAWSQGNLDTQWALKYFPSVRESAKQLISVSPDFHGSTLANIVDLGTDVGLVPMTPAFLQQEYNSAYVAKLRGNNGDSAYIPTTTFYSAVFDEIVQPQSGTGASAFIKDVRGVGVSNNEIQSVCGATPAGAIGTHESLLFNGFVVSLALEALKKGKAVQASEIDLQKACQLAVYPGLNLIDVLETEALIPLAGVNILQYIKAGLGITVEPKLKAYAQ